MQMPYGEGKKAFQRLQLEIIRVSSNHSIFAWDPLMPRASSVLAEDPNDFRKCGSIRKVERNEFINGLVGQETAELAVHSRKHQGGEGKSTTILRGLGYLESTHSYCR